MKRYEDMLMEILFFPAEDIIRTSSDFKPNEDKDNTEIMPETPYLPGV